jgi:hypothetical protein
MVLLRTPARLQEDCGHPLPDVTSNRAGWRRIPSTGNWPPCAVWPHEAADAGLLSPELAAGISRVRGVKLSFRRGDQSGAAIDFQETGVIAELLVKWGIFN